MTGTTTEKLARYETALETLGLMVAMRTHWIEDQLKQAVPDAARISQWEKEQDQFEQEESALLFEDTAGIENVIDTYGPVVRSHVTSL